MLSPVSYYLTTHAQVHQVQKEKVVTHASGTFEVKLIPQPPDNESEGVSLARMSIEKRFHGDLEGTSNGQMLRAATEVKGSAGYVAIERVTGTLPGRSGTFQIPVPVSWRVLRAP